jgi:4-amino-4-deoxy-L-arabinose transferase-like glycosyltransferase
MSRFDASVNWIAALVRRRPYAVLFFLCCIVWLPGVTSLPPLDRDESRFAQASKQMLESGNFVDIRFGMEPRYKKPIGIYWLQAAATEVASVATGTSERNHIWTYRIPSLLGAFAACAGILWCVRAFAPLETGFLAALLMVLTLLLTAEAKIAKTDAVLLACVVWANAVLMRVYLSARDPAQPAPSRKTLLAGWAAFAGAILIKGPVVFGVSLPLAAILSLWDRDWRWLARTKPLSGGVVTVLMVLPWFVAILLVSHGQFYELALGHDFGSKIVSGQETHGAPPGYYALLTTLSFWPATLFLLPALGMGVARRKEPVFRFLLCWLVGAWLLFELVPTKLPHYVLPVYPVLAILAALWAADPKPAETRVGRVLFLAAPVQFALGILAFAVAAIAIPELYGSGAKWWLYVAVSVFMACSLTALIAYIRRHTFAAVGLMLASVLVFYPAMTLGVAPDLSRLWVSPRAAAAVKALSEPGDPPVAVAGYIEPSMRFLLGTDTRLTNGSGAADVGVAQGGLALVEERQRPMFLARLAELEGDARQVGELDGLNYSRGKPVHIRIYRIDVQRDWAPPPPAE